ncbi:hypothetical protein ACOMHN_050978 [Nucella lapillus]
MDSEDLTDSQKACEEQSPSELSPPIASPYQYVPQNNTQIQQRQEEEKECDDDDDEETTGKTKQGGEEGGENEDGGEEENVDEYTETGTDKEVRTATQNGDNGDEDEKSSDEEADTHKATLTTVQGCIMAAIKRYHQQLDATADPNYRKELCFAKHILEVIRWQSGYLRRLRKEIEPRSLREWGCGNPQLLLRKLVHARSLVNKARRRLKECCEQVDYSKQAWRKRQPY